MKTSASNFLSVPLAGILELPNVILSHVFKYLNAVDLCRVNCVNKRLKTMSEDEELWKTQFENKYPLNERLPTESWKQAYKSSFVQEKLREDERKERERLLKEHENRNRNSTDPRNGFFSEPLRPGFGAPIVPGMIGGQSDLDPFASNPLGVPGNGMRPRGDPIYGPDGNLIFHPGPGRG